MSKFKKVFYTIIFVISLFLLIGKVYVDNIKPLKHVAIDVNDEITTDIFFKHKLGKINFVTDVEKIDTSKLGKYEVIIEVNSHRFKTELEVVDVDAPIVKVKNLKLGYYEDISADMFVEKIEDATECSVSFEKEIVKKVGKQKVVIVVVDEAHNKTKKEVELELVKVKEELTLEAGSTFELDSVLYGADKIEDKKIIQNIDTKKLGVQDLKLIVDGDEYTVKVTVEDTKAPVVTINNPTIWWDAKGITVDKFIKKVTDATTVKKELLTKIDYSKIGKQDVKIRVTDESGNVTEVTAKLTIKKDTTGPTIRNMTTISVVRGNSINYMSGVSAYDDHDGKVSVTYDASKVNTGSPGSYTVTYTAKDSSGNKTTKNRTIKITGNATDVKNKLQPIVSGLKAGSRAQTALNIRNWVAKNISYKTSNLKSLYPSAWEGITTRKGDCYTHMALTKIMLDLAGIPNQIMHTWTKGHYWNLIQLENSSWCHVDSTPGAKVTELRDDAGYEKVVKSKGWDHSSWPKAECIR